MATTTIYPFGQSAVIGGTSYVMAWDGLTEPSVANIPVGVSVTYQSQTYTGTMPASASTMGSIYLVANSSNPDVKDMYLTVVSGGNYVWTKMGSSSIDLTGYATEAWVQAREVDLTVAEYEALVSGNQVDPNKRYYVDEDE